MEDVGDGAPTGSSSDTACYTVSASPHGGGETISISFTKEQMTELGLRAEDGSRVEGLIVEWQFREDLPDCTATMDDSAVETIATAQGAPDCTATMDDSPVIMQTHDAECEFTETAEETLLHANFLQSAFDDTADSSATQPNEAALQQTHHGDGDDTNRAGCNRAGSSTPSPLIGDDGESSEYRDAIASAVRQCRRDGLDKEGLIAEIFKKELGQQYKNLNICLKAQSLTGMSTVYVTGKALVRSLGNLARLEDVQKHAGHIFSTGDGPGSLVDLVRQVHNTTCPSKSGDLLWGVDLDGARTTRQS